MKSLIGYIKILDKIIINLDDVKTIYHKDVYIFIELEDRISPIKIKVNSEEEAKECIKDFWEDFKFYLKQKYEKK